MSKFDVQSFQAQEAIEGIAKAVHLAAEELNMREKQAANARDLLFEAVRERIGGDEETVATIAYHLDEALRAARKAQ